MKSVIKIAVALALLLAAPGAFAQDADQTENVLDNTDAGTIVNNVATVTYEVGGNLQTAVDNTVADGADPDALPDGTQFVVDRAILVTVASVSGASVAPNQDDGYLTFTVTNDTNNAVNAADGFTDDDAYLDIGLTTVDSTGDDFNATLQIWVETNTIGGLQTADPDGAGLQVADTMTSVLDNVEEEDSFTVYVLGDIPGDALDTETSDVYLVATAHETDGAAGTAGDAVVETNVNAVDDPTVMDTVFGDADGDAAGTIDEDENGVHTDFETFTVGAADVVVTKISTIISDPFNGIANGPSDPGTDVFPKAIPGAIIEYCILITNNGAATADSVAVSDPIPANTTYFSSDSDTLDESAETNDTSIVIADDCDGTNGTYEDNDAIAGGVDDDTVGPNGNFDATGNGTVNTEVPTLTNGTVTATIFRVTVN